MDLQFSNTKSLKFTHNSDGVVVSYKRRTFILGYLSISRLATDFTDHEYLSHANAVLKFHCSVRNVPLHPLENFRPISPIAMEYDGSPISKYTSDEICENYLRNGLFQLGTIQQYRTIENRQQRDEFEGHSFLNLNINDHIVSVVVNSGFNYLIFCATKSRKSQLHRQKFGEREIEIIDVQGFADAITKRIRARRYFIQTVEYNTLKLYISKDKIKSRDVNVGSEILSPAFFDVLGRHLIYPSLFVKPESFRDEVETRIIFEMAKDQKLPVRFEDKALLQYLRFD